MNATKPLVLLLALLMLRPSAAEPAASQWPFGTKEAAVAGCRASIVYHSEQDFLKRHNLTELPAGFREKSALVMEPFLATCDCIFDHMEKEWSFEYFSSHQAEAATWSQELAKGECAPPVNKAAPRPDAQSSPKVGK